jgi:hypothetical protein
VGEAVAEYFFMVEFQNWITNNKNNDRLSIRSGDPDEIRMGYLLTVKHYTAQCWMIKL